MNADSEQNELAGNIKTSPTLVAVYILLGMITVTMSAMLCYYLYFIFK